MPRLTIDAPSTSVAGLLLAGVLLLAGGLSAGCDGSSIWHRGALGLASSAPLASSTPMPDLAQPTHFIQATGLVSGSNLSSMSSFDERSGPDTRPVAHRKSAHRQIWSNNREKSKIKDGAGNSQFAAIRENCFRIRPAGAGGNSKNRSPRLTLSGRVCDGSHTTPPRLIIRRLGAIAGYC